MNVPFIWPMPLFRREFRRKLKRFQWKWIFTGSKTCSNIWRPFWFAMAAILNPKWPPKYKNPPIWAKFGFQVDYDVANWYLLFESHVMALLNISYLVILIMAPKRSLWDILFLLCFFLLFLLLLLLLLLFLLFPFFSSASILSCTFPGNRTANPFETWQKNRSSLKVVHFVFIIFKMAAISKWPPIC